LCRRKGTEGCIKLQKQVFSSNLLKNSSVYNVCGPGGEYLLLYNKYVSDMDAFASI
jgi:hypothetical protein